MSNLRPWLTNLLLCLLGCGLVYLSHRYVSEHSVFTALGITGIAGWSAALYVVAALVVVTQPANRWTLAIILIFGAACRVLPLLAPPLNSTDIYRYVWDGIVQHAHINPYRYVPGDQALNFLRAPHLEIFDHMNRKDYARTIYPPIAQMIYFLVAWVSPTAGMMKLAMFGFEAVAVGAMIALLRWMGRPAEQVLLYAWCPLLVWEIGGAGHIDAVVIGFVALALLFRARENPVLTGLFLGMAVMTKFYPLVLFPALYRRGDWKMPATLAGVVIAGYAVYSSVGTMVFGFLGGYTEEEGMTTGARYFLLQWAQSLKGLQSLGTPVFLAFCGLVFLSITVWAWMRATGEASIVPFAPRTLGHEPACLRASAMFAFALMLLFSPHYPWYVAWLIPFLALMPRLPMMGYVNGFFYLFTTHLALPGPGMFLLNKILYGSVLGALLLQVVLACLPFRRWFHLAGVHEAPATVGNPAPVD